MKTRAEMNLEEAIESLTSIGQQYAKMEGYEFERVKSFLIGYARGMCRIGGTDHGNTLRLAAIGIAYEVCENYQVADFEEIEFE